MTIGSSPFLAADIDETFGVPLQWSPPPGGSGSPAALSPRLEL